MRVGRWSSRGNGLSRYQESYPMDADYLARVRGYVGLAFAASVYVALFERVLRRRLLCCEFTRGYVADHVIGHRFRRGDRSGLPYDIDYLNALVPGHVRCPGPASPPTDTPAD